MTAGILDTNLVMDRTAQNIEKAKEAIRSRKPTEAFSALWSAESFYQMAEIPLKPGNAYHDNLQALQERASKLTELPNYT